MINSSVYHQVARTYVADRLPEAERARIAREARDIRGARRLKSLPARRRVLAREGGGRRELAPATRS